MITEDYVSFETAKLLKEKGFDEKGVKIWYDESGEMYYDRREIKYQIKIENHEKFFQCPTLQMAMRWLRKNYGIHITGVPNGIGEDVFYMGIYRKYDYGWTYISDCLDEEYKEAEFYTPEEACEAAIKYCLEKLI